MARKRITEVFPFLTPIRVWQKNLFFYLGMFLDKNKYAKKFNRELLPFEECTSKTLMINEESGHDIIYQKNKVDNLKIISFTMNHIIIAPGEVFSFCLLARHSKKYGKYKEGLVSVNGKIVPLIGGGVCHLSNLLYYTFLKSPLTIVERHGHRVKSFPNPDKDSLEGVDATIRSGWLDLKVKNNTEATYQIIIRFDEDYMYVDILSDQKTTEVTKITNENFHYVKKGDNFYESVSIIKEYYDLETNKFLRKEKLYDEVVLVGYELPKDIEFEVENIENNS